MLERHKSQEEWEIIPSISIKLGQQIGGIIEIDPEAAKQVLKSCQLPSTQPSDVYLYLVDSSEVPQHTEIRVLGEQITTAVTTKTSKDKEPLIVLDGTQRSDKLQEKIVWGLTSATSFRSPNANKNTKRVWQRSNLVNFMLQAFKNSKDHEYTPLDADSDGWSVVKVDENSSTMKVPYRLRAYEAEQDAHQFQQIVHFAAEQNTNT